MKKILFVCHGNICRSPMAEFVMKDLVQKAGLTDHFYIESAATSTEEMATKYIPLPNVSWLSMVSLARERQLAR